MHTVTIVIPAESGQLGDRLVSVEQGVKVRRSCLSLNVDNKACHNRQCSLDMCSSNNH